MKTYAYARVSSQDQNLARQFDAFEKFGINPKFIFADKKSGKDFERQEYKKMIKKIKKGDLLIIKSIDRLGRNYEAIIREWNHITNTINANILVLDMPLLDTRAQNDSLASKLISDIVLQVLSFVAENERKNIRERQKEGIDSAQKRGVKFGRPKTEYHKDLVDIVAKYKANKITLDKAVVLSGMKKSNFYYHMRKILND